ncbi:hypothetical protein [Virgibacillus sp. Bac330]|uniref:hypothetical protein n=1 Tax=Virgibacillus sp. Bac330 TaxID=2419841 RepID=UPI0013CF1825|nr:hypothetical protein [Virgibacillus sp. Bac330]
MKKKRRTSKRQENEGGWWLWIIDFLLSFVDLLIILPLKWLGKLMAGLFKSWWY